MRGIKITMVKGLFIPCSADQPILEGTFNELSDYQQVVGGYIEAVYVRNHPFVLVVNEDGRAKRLAMNRRATILWWLHNPAAIGGSQLRGDVVIVGPVKHDDFTDVPANMIEMLLHTAQFQLQVLLSESSDTWVPIGEEVSNFFQAAVRALRLMEVWNPPTDVRVIAV